MRIVGFFVLFFLFLLISGWSILAMYYLLPPDYILRYITVGIFIFIAFFTIFSLFYKKWRQQALSAYLFVFISILVLYFSLSPSNKHHWQTDVEKLPYAAINGDLITVYNIRSFEYQSENEYSPAYYDKTFNLQELEGVDVIASYWMGDAIAHIFLSFAFSGGNHLAVSIEARKEKTEEYSTLKGFFRQYELCYIVADENDIIRLRTNYRKNPPEEVYLYRAKAPLENGQRLFLEYIHKINNLYNHPEFYNALTTNCTTNIWLNTHVNPDHLPLDWKILVSGYLPEYLYENNKLETYGLFFPDLKKRSKINDAAQNSSGVSDFSYLIREQKVYE